MTQSRQPVGRGEERGKKKGEREREGGTLAQGREGRGGGKEKSGRKWQCHLDGQSSYLASVIHSALAENGRLIGTRTYRRTDERSPRGIAAITCEPK